MTRATIDDLRDELSKGKITEADLRDPTCHLDGLCDYGSQRVYINPQPGVVEALLHELIHRRWPARSEARVDADAKYLLRHMTDADVARWYKKYQSLVRKRKRPRVIED